MPYRKSSSSAGRAPPSSAEARAAQPASVIWAPLRSSVLSLASPPVGSGSAPAGGGGGATRAMRPSWPSGLPMRRRLSSEGSRRKAGARATSPASPISAPLRKRCLSRGMAPRPRAAASAEAPAYPTCMSPRSSEVKAGSAPAPSPSASRCTPSAGS
eukprot:scaffold107832_cov54-Phaeocystis_antarctica.AAC.3